MEDLLRLTAAQQVLAPVARSASAAAYFALAHDRIWPLAVLSPTDPTFVT